MVAVGQKIQECSTESSFGATRRYARTEMNHVLDRKSVGSDDGDKQCKYSKVEDEALLQKEAF